MAAWRKAGLWPVDREVMRALTPPPPAAIDPAILQTPQSVKASRQLARSVRQQQVDPTEAFHKLGKAFETEVARGAVTAAELEKIRAQQEVDKAVRGGGKRTKFPLGVVFDQRYRETHAAELADWGRAERARNEKKAADAAREKDLARSKGKGKQKTLSAGPSKKR